MSFWGTFSWARSERQLPQRRIRGLQSQISLECWPEMVVEVPPQDNPHHEHRGAHRRNWSCPNDYVYFK
ncbi:hypothetical protein PHMEG_00010254 [Phytophthora megakarya]|uniref:Uncharacterized protein n=1 Tax=Phytophthora megakarya TaxID=4795 RepID=A0A225WEP4_9STRA|nr:hypothetical protein PHMEG_00010254 [Phytophthora megakarya]